MRWKVDRHVDGVNNTPKQVMACGTLAVTCVQFLKQEEFLALFGVLPVKGPEQIV